MSPFVSSAARVGSARFERLDALRGLAVIWMVGFHFCFDLNHFGFIKQNFYADPFWTGQRTAIVSLFLFCAGLGQAVATEQGQTWHRFWRRWTQIAACAVLVSVGSWWMFPQSFITFGVLHGIAVMVLLVRLGSPGGRWLWVIGLIAIILPSWVQHPFFDSRWTQWVGLVTQKPVTEDYVPILPWLGVMLWGVAFGQWALKRRPTLIRGACPAWMRPVAALGRWSLSVYMVHQPVMIGTLMAVVALR